ncbi:hypothetical protein D3874_01665 [Oleomonas cavernae]|uniref:Host specificity protein n=1 Tax=Oleomonas cavernae TaxID=2320859 RepID=A0A418WTJ1_9PROT|nr:glycoside hydrolase/phage tail family protein [Oleomonas cavernae]RJF94570.1 hypothetical protein D3874_01665 [Oleomonas cavernae]
MATLVLTAAVSSFAAGAPGWVLAATAVAGAVIDSYLFAPPSTRREGPRLTDLQVQASAEGAPIPDMAGRLRLGGQVIWAAKFREVASTQKVGGGKGGGGGAQKTTTYAYYASFAVALCEGPVDRLGRVWADGKPLDLTGVTWRFYPGAADQLPDPLIEGIEGAAPAYRGTAYVVFENLGLERFGNRLPQLAFELCRRIGRPGGDSIEDLAQAVTLIPGAGEFAYDTRVVTAGARAIAAGAQAPQNRSATDARADWHAALDDLAASLPNVTKVFLVVGWFGDDLRCGYCRIMPRAETALKYSFAGRAGIEWRVHGHHRGQVPIVSINALDGRIAYGGTPSDESVVRAIRDLAARGYEVVLYPFLFMDVPAGNVLPDPYSDGASGVGQAAYPWRGRITCSPAPGFAGSPDKSIGVEAQVAAFVGAVTAGQVSVSVGGDNAVSVGYSGPDEWSWRRLILHYARLAAAVNALDAGAVTGFLIGSELRGLTALRSDAASFPFVGHLQALAADCRAILGGGVKLSYAADWSEYFGHQPADGSGDVFFHLDPLWADGHIDFVGIDNYLPLSDWRDGADHLDYAAGVRAPHDPAYLAGNVEAGEYFDWFYATPGDRAGQSRTPISDGTYGKPWVFRPKDLRGWWSNAHYDRPGGVEAAMPTAWVPLAKPIWFTELGIPSIDKGTNQPNVFYDPKSAESALPHFSAGTRDDVIQRAGLEAWLRHWRGATNPVSALYGGPMVETQALWTWDARPFPAWPARDDLWGDGDLWPLGHWLNGKVGFADLAGLVAHLCARVGLGPDDIDVSALHAVVPGYLRDRPLSPRGEVEALMQAFGFDAVESAGVLRFLPRGQGAGIALATDDLVAEARPQDDLALTRGQETDLPVEISVGFSDLARDFRTSAITSRRLVGGAAGRAALSLPLVLDEEQARGIAERLLIEAWTGRNTARFGLAPSHLALDPGDILRLDTDAGPATYRITRVSDDRQRTVEAIGVEPSARPAGLAGGRPVGGETLPPPLGLALAFLDLPLLTETALPHAAWVAASSVPAAPVAVMDSVAGDSFALDTVLPVSATMGETLYDFYNGPTDFWDEGNVLGVELYGGTLAAADREALLAGPVNALALRNGDGDWEIVQFAQVKLLAPRRYNLSGLLRGRLGTEQAMRAPLAAGAAVVLLDGALRQLDMGLAERHLERYYRWGPAALPMTDPAWAAASFTPRAVGLRPYAPVHVAGVRDGAGNLAITWVRRTRLGGAWADLGDVALGEEVEAYEVDILDGAGPAVKRTIAVTAPAAGYSAAQAMADFGYVPAAVVVRVAQVSTLYGRGLAATATI